MEVDVLIIGAGNQGLAMAGYLSTEGYSVGIWNRTYDNIAVLQRQSKIYIKGAIETEASIKIVTSDIEDVNSRLIIVTTPTDSHNDIARLLSQKVLDETIIILSPGRTFGALNFKHQLVKYKCKYNPIIVETQTIIHTARLVNQTTVYIYGFKHDVLISSICPSVGWYKFLPNCLRKYYKRVDSYVYTSLGNVGMILHCLPTLLNIGCIESKDISFKYYIDGISPSISRLLELLDQERLNVAFNLGYNLISTKEWLESSYSIKGNDLFDTIQINAAYSELLAPNTKFHRYIHEDVPNGLVPLEYLAHDMGIKCSLTTLTIDLANLIMNVDYRKIGRTFRREELYNI